jgi:hypothetical protein
MIRIVAVGMPNIKLNYIASAEPNLILDFSGEHVKLCNLWSGSEWVTSFYSKKLSKNLLRDFREVERYLADRRNENHPVGTPRSFGWDFECEEQELTPTIPNDTVIDEREHKQEGDTKK